MNDFWLGVALEDAGIDADRWRPWLGVDANRGTIEAVYDYYGRLYVEHPELQWMGMASLLGASFAAGFDDLDAFGDAIPSAFQDVTLASVLPGFPTTITDLADATKSDFRYYENTLLQMQKDIFLDLVPMHEAYLAGGMPAIREMYRARLITPGVYDGWKAIDRGARDDDQESSLATGAMAFAEREQQEVLQPRYDALWNHNAATKAITTLISNVGRPSIPGAHGLPEDQPLDPGIDTLGPKPILGVDNPLQGRIMLDTPWTAANVADRRDRWHLFLNDTMPAYQRLLQEKPEVVTRLASTPVADRMGDYRMSNRIDEVAGRLFGTQLRFVQ